MRRAWGYVTLITLIGFCRAPGTIAAGEETKSEGGWISLFNGKDFTGWKISENGDWKVEDGVIVGGGKHSHLFTEQEFQNFEFKTDVMINRGGNSGIYFHTKYEQTWPSHGYEVQINNTHGDPWKSGSLWSVSHVLESAAQDNKWFTVHITVKGKHITTKVNGKVMIDYIEPPGVTGNRRVGKGSFAFQAHDPKSIMRFRNVMVKPLP